MNASASVASLETAARQITGGEILGRGPGGLVVTSQDRGPERRGRGGSCGSSRGRGGRRVRSRSTPCSRVSAACLEATKGWKVQTSVGGSSIMLEEDFTNSVLSDRTRMYVKIAMERLEQSLIAHALAPIRASMLFVMVQKPISLCQQWLNEMIRIHKVEQPVVTLEEMLRWFAIMLISHSTSYPPDLTLRIITKCSDVSGRENLMDLSRYR